MNTVTRTTPPSKSAQWGAILPLAVAAMIAIVGLSGVGIDIGFIVWNKRQLHAAVDAAALAGAQDLLTKSTTEITARVRNYSARYGQGVNADGGGGQQVSGSTRWYNDLAIAGNVTVNPPSVQFASLSKSQVGLNPGTLSGANALRVTQTAVIRPFFLSFFGMNSITISASSSASAGGGAGAPPINLMLILDTSGSMSASESCGITSGTKLKCALKGARALVGSLTSAGNNVGVAVNPPVSSTSVVNEHIDCGNTVQVGCNELANYMVGGSFGDNATAGQISTIIPMTNSSAYASGGNLLTTTNLAKVLAVPGAGTNCGLKTPNRLNSATSAAYCSHSWSVSSTCTGAAYISGTCYTGQSYFAQAIKQAQTNLSAMNNDQKNVIVILSDGDANADAMDGYAVFTGSVAQLGTSGSTTNPLRGVLTVTAVSYGKIKRGSVIKSGTGSGDITSNTTIEFDSSNSDATAAKACLGAGTKSSPLVKCTGTGALGTYRVSIAQTRTSRTINAVSDSTFLSNQCQQGIVEANVAKAAGTTIYVIGYGVPGSGCPTDDTNHPNLVSGSGVTPCNSLRWMAGTTASTSYPGAGSPYYYATSSSCESTVNTTNSDLTEVFKEIAEGISSVGSRTIPDDAW